MIALVFAINQARRDLLRRDASTRNRAAATFWGGLAGFTSFIARAGGPPFQACALPLNMEKVFLVGTGVMFFAIVYSAKIAPFFALGQFDADIGVLIGVWAVTKVSQTFFDNLTYLAMLVVGTKLVWDGRAALGL